MTDYRYTVAQSLILIIIIIGWPKIERQFKISKSISDTTRALLIAYLVVMLTSVLAWLVILYVSGVAIFVSGH